MFDMEDVIKKSAKVEERTFEMLKSDGKFKYQVDPRTDKPINGEYNLLRHFGTLWYLGGSTNNAKRAFAIKGLKWAEQFLKPMAMPLKGKAYVYRESIKTGGIALAILAKLALNSLDNIDELVEFLLSVQKPDGDFIHKLDLRGRDTGFKSEYYTGEILFALASVQAVRPNKKLIEACVKCLDGLISSNYGVQEQSHWMMYALTAMFKVNNNPIYAAQSNAIAQSIIKYTDFQSRGATPIGCRIEGLLANAMILKEQSPILDAYKVRFNAIEQNIELMLEHYQRGYFVKSGITQIDYQQHCGAAMRNYVRLAAD